MTPEDLVILGAGSFAIEVGEAATLSGRHVVEAYLDDRPDGRQGGLIGGVPILDIADAAKFAASHQAICSLATTHRSKIITPAVELGYDFAVVAHPAAVRSPSSDVGRGSFLGAGSILAAESRLGEHVLVNRAATVGHHTTIGRLCTISLGAHVAGCVTIGERTYVGMGAKVLDHVTIGERCIIGAGAVVTRDVPDRCKVMGVPARIVEKEVDGL